MSTRGFAAATAAAKSISEPELLLAVSAKTSSSTSFVDAVEQVEGLLVDAAVCAGLVVLETRGDVSFPVAGKGGPIPAAEPERILWNRIQVFGHEFRVVFLADDAERQRFGKLVEFVTEQIRVLLIRDHLLGRHDALKVRVEQMHDELTALKLVARAKGLLIIRRQLSARAAERWIEQESRKGRTSVITVAREIIAAYAEAPEDAASEAERRTA